MITSIEIKNFKSVVDLKLDLGTFNVLIGENGCGKSNILEAIAFGAAASADKLDYEFFGSRGLRLTNTEFVFPAFHEFNKEKIVNLNFTNNENFFPNDKTHKFQLIADPENSKKWKNIAKDIFSSTLLNSLEKIIFSVDDESRKNFFDSINGKFEHSEEFIEKINAVQKQFSTLKDFDITDKIKLFNVIFSFYINDTFSNPYISNFIIYTPEQSSLRRFEESNQIYPLGVKGEGLFQYLKNFVLNKENRKEINEIKKVLSLLDWYENFSLPKNSMQNEFTINIKDKYLNNSLKYFDQRSTNEGFLFLLFYSVLFISKETPSFFAIDNIDTAFNPKLCRQIIKTLFRLAKKYNKQVILTTHNPAILDGLNLQDDTQRLFVVRRNDEGYTKAKRIEYKSERKMNLSELWTKGYIGGLPDNF